MSLRRALPLLSSLLIASFPPRAARAQGEAKPAPPPAGTTPSAPPAPAAPPSDDEAGDEDAGDEAEVDDGEAQKAEEEAAADEAESEDMGDDADLAGEDPARPPPQGKGVVWGVVRDVEGELIEAPVQVIGHKKAEGGTDEEGRYRLELAPGTYSLRFSYELHKSVRMDGVVVRAGKVLRLDASLLTDEEAVDVIEVVEEADKSTMEGTNLARQRATAVGDSVGRAEISRTPAANAAQAAQRVPGASIVGNRYVYVRGLGERYTNALLNGAPLPSPEPDRAAIPLDVFPSLIIDNLSIVKTFTPDSPADFAGGSVRIQTRELPTKPLLQASIGLGYDTGSTFRGRLAQRGSSTDWLGYDDGTRDLPPELQGRSILELSPQEVASATQGINSYMSALRNTSPPNYGLSFVAGDGWKLPGDQRMGALVTFNYGRSYLRQPDAIVKSLEPSRGIDYHIDHGNDKVAWGSLAQVSYWPSAYHRLTLLGIHTQLADSNAQILQGFNANVGGQIVDVGLRYVSRSLNFGQLRGEHDFPKLSNARLEWNAALSNAGRDEPDTRHAIFTSSQGSEYFLSGAPESGSHLHAEQGETALGGGLDWTQPLTQRSEGTRLKLGGSASLKSRDFAQQRFHLGQVGTFFSCGNTFYRECPDTIYTPQNIDAGVLELGEDTRPEDAYEARLNVYAGYGMVDLEASKDLRVVGGVRLEKTLQKLDPYSQFEDGVSPDGGRIDVLDWLPSVSLAYSATKKTKLRAAVARTLARPQLRELAPYSYGQFFDATPFAGNPDLVLTHIMNYDLRFEFYPTLKEVLAFSFFYKTFRDPIENVVNASGSSGIIKPQNTEGATLAGIELEGRKSLDFLSPALSDLSLISNLTLAHSRIEIGPGSIVTNKSRPMTNQAPYVLNLSLDYDNERLGLGLRLLYNLVGKRVVEVGASGLPDTYQQPTHTLDFTAQKTFGKHVQLKFTAMNLLALDTLVTWGPDADGPVARIHNVAQTAGETTYFSDSRVFNLSATYTY